MMYINNAILRRDYEPNTFIGRAGEVLTDKSVLADKYNGISVQNIKNFHIDSNMNVSCHINKNYSIKRDAFRNTAINGITYYIDIDGRCVDLDDFNAFRGCNDFVCILPKAQGTGAANTFAQGSYRLISIPAQVPIGRSVEGDSSFLQSSFTGNVFVNHQNETINNGNPDGDITQESNVQPWIIYGGNNQDKPDAPEIKLDILALTFTSFKIDITFPNHSNDIYNCVVFLNGDIYEVNEGETSTTFIDLSTGSYTAKVMIIDSEGNNSKMSNEIQVTL